MRKLIIILALALALTGCATSQFESKSFKQNYSKAQKFHKAERFELAREYYLLAMAAAKNNDSVAKVEKNLFAVERQIITLR